MMIKIQPLRCKDSNRISSKVAASFTAESHFTQNYLHRATTKPFISKTASSVYLLLLASNYSRSNNKVVDGGEMLRLRELYALDI